jgi:dihydrofolate reductase
MAKLIYALNQSLDGYVDHDRFAPQPDLFRHFVQLTREVTGSLYGRRMYEIMNYWDTDHQSWGEDERAYADAWRAHPKWVVSTTLSAVGPNAALLQGDLKSAVVRLKEDHEGVIEVAGPVLAQSLTDLGLIDEYRIYLHPVVLGHGAPFFRKAHPPLRLTATDRFGDVIRLTYVP